MVENNSTVAVSISENQKSNAHSHYQILGPG